MSLVRGAGSLSVPGAGPPAYVSGWYYGSQVGRCDENAPTTTFATGTVWYVPIYVFQSQSFDLAAVVCNGTGGSGQNSRVAVYSHNATYGPRTLMKDFGVIAHSAVDDTPVYSAESAVSLPRGWYWLAFKSDATVDLFALIGANVAGEPWNSKQDFGSPVLTTKNFYDERLFLTATEAYAAYSTTATAPTAAVNLAPHMFLKAT